MYHALYVVCMHFSLKPHKTPKKKITDKIKNYVKKMNMKCKLLQARQIPIKFNDYKKSNVKELQ